MKSVKMLRDWNASSDEQNGGNYSLPREQSDPPETESNSLDVIRGWSIPAAAPEVMDEEVEHEFGNDPLASPPDDVSGLSMPVFAEVAAAVRNPFDDEAFAKLDAHEMEMNEDNEQHVQMTRPCSEVIGPSFTNVDVESPGLPYGYRNAHTSNHEGNMKSGSYSSIKRKMNEIRSNPAAKFRVIVGISVFIVVVCVVAIAGTSSTDKSVHGSSAVGAPTKGSSISTTIEATTPSPTNSLTPMPSQSNYGTLELASSKITDLPTFSPTAIPTYMLEVPPTDLPSPSPVDPPSSAPTLSPTTASPTETPITLAPTMDCSDADGTYLTYNEKLRDCAWLDNGHNGAKSDRKDMNCISSELGDKCRYTCRLYNDCMDDLLSRIDAFSEGNDFSIGDECTDKDGTFMGNNHIPRNCTWIEEDPHTAPMKKNLNCGTPVEPRTELGAMCPRSCAGYNRCDKDGTLRDDNKLMLELDDDGDDDQFDAKNDANTHQEVDKDDDDDADMLIPTLAPSFDSTNDAPGLSMTLLSDSENTTCVDKDGEFQTHLGPAHLRQCRWFNRDGDGLTIADKIRLNCHKTELGMHCLETCGCFEDRDDDNALTPTLVPTTEGGSSETPTYFLTEESTSCVDAEGEFQTHVGPAHFRQCRWFNRDDNISIADKKKLNCHITEIGMNCQKTCGCLEYVDDDNALIPTLYPTSATFSSDVPTYFDNTEEPSTIMPTIESCTDTDGEFQTHISPNHFRQCRWFNRDGDGLTIADKKRLNCHITEIGMNCLGFCGCIGSAAWEIEDKQVESCKDPTGLFETDDPGIYKTCDWLDTNAKKKLNCGLTEIGLACICQCPVQGHSSSQNVLVQDVAWDFNESSWDFSKVTPRPSKAPTRPPKKYEGLYDDSGKVLTLVPYADTTITESDANENYGDSLVLGAAPPTNRMQSLLLFDLSFVSKNFEAKFGNAKLRLYATAGSPSGGLIFKQMDGANWKENKVTWNNTPGGDGSNELILSFLYNVVAGTWYEVDVTPAVRDAVERGRQYMSIRIESDDAEFSFASKEKDDVQPQLIVDSNTQSPTFKPTYAPSPSPSISPAAPTAAPSLAPVIPLTCQDSKGKFRTSSGERQSCSWFDVGEGSLKKEQNCNGEAKMFCQSKCSEYNGCDDMTCEDRAGSYATHSGWTAECSWLTSGLGTLKLEQNCGTDEYQITELGKRCQSTCRDYNGCSSKSAGNTPYLQHLTAYNGELSNEEPHAHKAHTASTSSTSVTLPDRIYSSESSSLPTSPIFDCLDHDGTFKTNTGQSEKCSWFDTGNVALKKELNCQGDREARLLCQSQCGAYNGCKEITWCKDMEGSYTTNSGWRAECSWLSSGQGTLKLEQNCGTDVYPITELGKKCQATCRDYNGCNSHS